MLNNVFLSCFKRMCFFIFLFLDILIFVLILLLIGIVGIEIMFIGSGFIFNI